MSWSRERAEWEREWDVAMSRVVATGDNKLLHRLICGPRLTIEELRSLG